AYRSVELLGQSMEAQRAVYHKRTPYSPYQNQNPASTFGRKKYTIGAPRPGQKPDEFRGIDTLSELKRTTVNPKRSMLEDVPILLQSRNRRVLKFTPRIVSDSTSATVSVQDNIGAVQEVRTEEEDIVSHLERRKMSFGVSCSECSDCFYSRVQLCQHVASAHGIPAPIIQKEFDTEEMFKAWTNVLKRTHAVDFVYTSGSRNYVGREQKIRYLQCSRSGDQKIIPKRNVKRPRGSSKCGKMCLAYLKVSQTLRHNRPWGPIKVEGCLHHSGHYIDPEKIVLTYEEEQAVRQLIESNNRIGPVDLSRARAILYPCARFRLITDELLLQVLPRWMWHIRSLPDGAVRQEDVEWDERDLVGERRMEEEEEEEDEVDEDEEERRQHTQNNMLTMPQSSGMEEPYGGLDDEILEFDEGVDDDFIVSVDS
ncbi:hypothetical protein PFISCL1PPCAC_8199, partial [Pristionchus fissidentatus]